MKFHKEGYPTLLVIIIFSAALLFSSKYFFAAYPIVYYLAIAISVFLLVTVIQFFRSPTRSIEINANHIISPCDGKVVVIEEVQETEFINEKRRQVSIFMSPINVHNNRYPISGIVKYFKYHPGKYLVAWHPKSSTDNERTTVVVEDDKGRSVLFRQIAGALARRIVFYGNEGDKAQQGSECGFIKFGSRVDLLLPMDVEINVDLEQKVVGGKSIIATFKN